VSKRLVLGLLFFALVVRGGVLLIAPEALSADPDGYRALAENLLDHGTFGYEHAPTAYRPPLYPLMLVPCVAAGAWSTAAIGALHVLMGLVTVGLVFHLARRCGLGRLAWVAAALTACDPILLGQSTLVMSETASTMLAVVAMVCLAGAAARPTVSRAAIAGAALGLATLCRAELIVWTVCCAVLLGVLVQSWSVRWKLAAVLVAAAAVVLTPWAVRNGVQFGRPIVTTTHGGYTLLLGNNPAFYEYLQTGPWGSVWDAEELGLQWQREPTGTTPAEELRADRRAYQQAWTNIQRQPRMFGYSCLVRTGRLWSLAPHAAEGARGPHSARSISAVRYAVGVWYFAVLLSAAVGGWAVWKRRFGSRATWLGGAVLVVCLTAVHTVYWSNMRMRAPLMPVVAMAAAAGIGWLGNRAKIRKSG
jgi:4-amino-4-deoxy-L-arabinose transferase-like glycosyltransferase